MRQSISLLVFRETVRSRRFWLALAAGALLSTLPMVIPVRFKDPIEFSIESGGATLLLWGMLFGALCVLPSLSRDRFVLRSQAVGAWPRPNLLLALEHGWGQLLAFLGASTLILALQWVILWASPFWRGGPGAEFSQWAALAAVGCGGILQGVALVALARLLGPFLPPAAAQLTFLTLVVSTHFLAWQWHQGAGGEPPEWWVVALGLFLPAIDLMQGVSSAAGWLWAILAVSTYWVTSNIVLTWVLERIGDTLVCLDDRQGEF